MHAQQSQSQQCQAQPAQSHIAQPVPAFPELDDHPPTVRVSSLEELEEALAEGGEAGEVW